MKSGRLQAFSFCPTCRNIRAVRGGMITYFPDSTRIQGTCTTCGGRVDILGHRHPGPRIGANKRQLN